MKRLFGIASALAFALIASVLVGGLGLFFVIRGFVGLVGLSDDEGLAAYGLVYGVVVGAGLLLIGALLGFIALFLRQRFERLVNYEPPEAIHYYTRWQSPGASDDPGDWERGPDFYKLNSARRWAQSTARLHGVSVVEIYTEESTGAKVVETVRASIDTDP